MNRPHQQGDVTIVRETGENPRPSRHAVPPQTSLSRNDALDEYTQHVGSAIFAIPPGVRNTDDWWGRELFA